jgi:putative membrane protein
MKRFPVALWLLITTAVAFGCWSFLGARKLDVWVFELVPGTVGVAGLVVLSKRFAFSALTYSLISVSFVIIATGARYTYAEMPLFDWLQDEFGTSRNHFDRFGHFFQGLTVGLMTREVLIRKTTIGRYWGVPILSVAFSLSFSALYELLEWWVVMVFYPDEGARWLGLQGDQWDAQWDMSMALVGSVTAVLPFAGLHDWSIRHRQEQCERPRDTVPS